jgi:glutaredoxin
MDKKVIISTILFVTVFIISVFALSQDKENNLSDYVDGGNQEAGENQIILFYGDGCPHCKIVEEYINENNVQSKISFAQKEVYYNQGNAKELKAKARICGLPTNSIGVPFLWDGEKCYIGDYEIIDFFSNR